MYDFGLPPLTAFAAEWWCHLGEGSEWAAAGGDCGKLRSKRRRSSALSCRRAAPFREARQRRAESPSIAPTLTVERNPLAIYDLRFAICDVRNYVLSLSSYVFICYY